MNGAVLRGQMRLRGLTGAALARLTGLSDATISNALAGRRLHPSTFRLIAAGLAKVEVVPGAEALAAGSADEDELGIRENSRRGDGPPARRRESGMNGDEARRAVGVDR
jgi:transcriptional regulator with XRE-family HTH domain